MDYPGGVSVGELTDEGISGSNGLETRAGLGDAFEYLKRGKAEGLVVSQRRARTHL